MTAEDVIQAAVSFYGIPDVGSNGFSLLDSIERDVYSKITSFNQEDYWSEFTLTIVNGTQAYSLPADFGNIRPRGCGVFKIEDGKKTQQIQPVDSKYSSNTGFHISLKDDKIYMTPTPSVDTTYTLVYIPKRTVVSTGSYVTILSSVLSSEDFSDYYRLRYYLEFLENYSDFADQTLMAQLSLKIQELEKSWIKLLKVTQPKVSLTMYRKSQLNSSPKLKLY